MRVLARGRVRWAALLAIVGALAVGGVAYAMIPDANGVIHGCFKKSGGALRVIDSAVTNCASNEISLNWNQTGLPGAPGAPGAPGEPGAPGPTGPTQGVGATGTGGASPPSPLTNQHDNSGLFSSTFTTSVSGRLHLSKPFVGALSCPDSITNWWWITLDGTPVSSSLAINVDGVDFSTMTLVGVTSSIVAAGTHTMGVQAMCDFGSASANAGAVGYSGGTAIVLG